MGWLFKAQPLLVNHVCAPPKPQYNWAACDIPEPGSLWQCDYELCAKVWVVKDSHSTQQGFETNTVKWREYKGGK